MLPAYTMLHELGSILDTFVEPGYKNDYLQLNYFEENDKVKVRFNLPGASIEDIDLQLENNVLKISFEKKPGDAEARFIRRERPTGTFSKAIRMPYRVDPDKVSAYVRDGVLYVTLEKAEEAKPEKIEIK